jgi:hypothetical protein
MRLAVGDAKGTVKVFSVGPSRRAVRYPVLNPHCTGCTWSADSRHLFCTTKITREDILSLHRKMKDGQEKQQGQPFRGPGPPLLGEPLIVTLERNAHHRIQLVDAATGLAVKTWKASGKLVRLAASPDGKWLAAATGEGLLQLWPAQGGGQPVTLGAPKPKPPAGARPNVSHSALLCWSPEGTLLASSAGGQTTIRLWDSRHPRAPVRELPGHGKALRSLAWSPGGERLASAAMDGTIVIWDALRGKKISNLPYAVMQEGRGFGNFGGTFAFSVLAWGPGNRLAVAGEDEKIHVWDTDPARDLGTRAWSLSPEPDQRHHIVCSVAWSPDGKRLAAVNPAGSIVVWETETWAAVLDLRPEDAGTFPGRMTAPGHAGELAWSPDSKQLALFRPGGDAIIWEGTPKP